MQGFFLMAHYGWVRLLSVAALLLLAACQQAVPEGQAALVATAPEVAVASVSKKPVPLTLSYTAQTQGSREVEVRARVSGILLKRAYREGATVRQGDILFEIDPATFEAAVAQDRGTLAVARANQVQAKRNRDRILPLVEKGLASAKERDDALSAVDVADAQVQAAAASVRAAELDLSYTKVRAPISGITSREARSEGSLINAGTDSSLLTRIVQVEPLYIEFAAPEQEAVTLRAAWARAKGGNLAVSVALDGGATDTAKLSFIDSAVDAASGTVRMRAVLDNRQHRLWPGQFVRVQLADLLLDAAISIPRMAVLSSPQGYMVWVLDTKNAVQMRVVKLGAATGDAVLITEGLQVGERYLLDGLLKVQAGVIVQPIERVGTESAAAVTQASTGST